MELNLWISWSIFVGRLSYQETKTTPVIHCAVGMRDVTMTEGSCAGLIFEGCSDSRRMKNFNCYLTRKWLASCVLAGPDACAPSHAAGQPPVHHGMWHRINLYTDHFVLHAVWYAFLLSSPTSRTRNSEPRLRIRQDTNASRVNGTYISLFPYAGYLLPYLFSYYFFNYFYLLILYILLSIFHIHL